MATWTQNFSSGWCSMTLSVSESGTSAATNSGTISWKLTVKSLTGTQSSFNQSSAAISVTIGGKSRYSSSSFSISGLTKGSSKTIASGSFTQAHNSDGSLSLACSASFKSGVSLGNASVSGTFTGTKIARASKVSVSATSVTAGGSFNVTVTPYASFSHRVTLTMGSLKVTATSTASASAKTIAVNVPVSWASSIPTAMSAKATLKVETLSGSTVIGSAYSTSITVNVPSYTLSGSISLGIVNPMPGTTSVYVQGKSSVKATISVSPMYGGTIKNYSTTFNGVKYTTSSFTSGVLKGPGTYGVTATVTDSRGKTATVKSANITVYGYNAPTITSVTAARNSTTPTTATLTVKGKFSSVNGNNTATVYAGDSANKRAAAPGEGFTVTFTFTAVNTDKTYTGSSYVTDKYGSSAKYAWSIPTIAAPMDIKADGNGIAFGKVAEINGLDVGWDMTVRKTIKVQNVDFTLTDAEYNNLISLLR